MTITTTRRGFLGLLGLGTAAAALAEPLIVEPVRRFWQVGSNAPVGSRIERADEFTWAELQKGLEVYFSEPIWLSGDNGFTYNPGEVFSLSNPVPARGVMLVNPRTWAQLQGDLDELRECDLSRRPLSGSAPAMLHAAGMDDFEAQS